MYITFSLDSNKNKVSAFDISKVYDCDAQVFKNTNIDKTPTHRYFLRITWTNIITKKKHVLYFPHTNLSSIQEISKFSWKTIKYNEFS